MLILGIDPGATTGWCIYSTEERAAIESGIFKGHGIRTHIRDLCLAAHVVVIESMIEPHGKIFPAVVQAGITEGRLTEHALMTTAREPELLSRHDVKLTLTAATQRTVVVTDDKTAWQALALLHGEGSDRKPRRKGGVIVEPGGPLGPESAQATLAAKAAKWMDANPSAMALFRRFATEALLAGRRIGIGAIAERVRWECAVQTSGDTFKVNNNHSAYIARRLIAEMPALASIIETRSAGS